MIRVLLVAVLTLGGFIAAQEQDVTNERIVGGQLAGKGQFPYMASLRDKSNRHICGGSIIDRSWILTAAQCAVGQKPKELRVYVGTNYLNSGGKKYKIKKVIIHPSYNARNKTNDIALLRTSSKIKFDKVIRPIAVANSTIKPNSYCILTGWGTVKYPSNVLSNALRQISLKTISIPQCKKKLGRYPVSYTNECTYNRYGEGACNGDSGSPLTCRGVLSAILSWGVPCARGSPDVYTGVAFYRKWIKSVAKV